MPMLFTIGGMTILLRNVTFFTCNGSNSFIEVSFVNMKKIIRETSLATPKLPVLKGIGGFTGEESQYTPNTPHNELTQD